jgi:hypothetical protein
VSGGRDRLRSERRQDRHLREVMTRPPTATRQRRLTPSVLVTVCARPSAADSKREPGGARQPRQRQPDSVDGMPITAAVPAVCRATTANNALAQRITFQTDWH